MGIHMAAFLARVHSTKAAKSSREPTSDDSALHAVFRLESLNAQRAGGVSYEQEQSCMVLERSVLQDEEFGPDEGIHG